MTRTRPWLGQRWAAAAGPPSGDGAGKSTAVDLLLGLREPDEGAVAVLGGSPARAVAAGRVGGMLQTGALPQGARVRDVLALARSLYGVRRSVGELVELADLGALVGHVELSAVQWLSFVLLVLAASLPISFLGLLLGQLLDAQAAQPVQGLLTMLLSFGGGLFLPLSAFPSTIRTVAGALPSHLFFQGGQDLVANRAPAAADVVGIAVWALGLAAGALLVWSRQGGRRVALG